MADVEPVKRMTCHQIPEELEKDAEEHIRELVSTGIIEECPHPTAPSVL